MRRIFTCAAVILVAASAMAADWPQWMGPTRDGVVERSPALVDAFGEGGPKVLWTSEEIIGGWAGGWGTVAVSADAAYVYSSHNYNVPKDERVIDIRVLRSLGADRKLPDDLRDKVEAARTGEARKALKDGRKIRTWVNAWVKENAADQRQLLGVIRQRLQAGPDNPSPAQLEKLRGIRDRKFEKAAALDAWFVENDIKDPQKKRVLSRVSKTNRVAKDHLVRLDAATGKTVWRKSYDGQEMAYPASTTPTIVYGRITLLDSLGNIACFSEKDGELLWKTECPKRRGWRRTRSSSVLVTDGVAVVQAEAGAIAVDATTGKELWRKAALGNEGASPFAWKKDGATYLVVNGGNKVNLVALKTGNVLWSVRGGGDGSPVVVDDTIVICLGGKGGIKAFPASLEEPKELWAVPLKDDYTTPVVYEGHVYAVGGAGSGKALCIELKTGKVKWEAPMPKDAEYGAPVFADGKLIFVAGKELYIIRATPEKYDLLAKADLGIEKWTAPTFVDGKVFLRRNKAILCVDLRK